METILIAATENASGAFCQVILQIDIHAFTDKIKLMNIMVFTKSQTLFVSPVMYS